MDLSLAAEVLDARVGYAWTSFCHVTDLGTLTRLRAVRTSKLSAERRWLATPEVDGLLIYAFPDC